MAGEGAARTFEMEGAVVSGAMTATVKVEVRAALPDPSTAQRKYVTDPVDGWPGMSSGWSGPCSRRISRPTSSRKRATGRWTRP